MTLLIADRMVMQPRTFFPNPRIVGSQVIVEFGKTKQMKFKNYIPSTYGIGLLHLRLLDHFALLSMEWKINVRERERERSVWEPLWKKKKVAGEDKGRSR